jgi:hypothetical protein
VTLAPGNERVPLPRPAGLAYVDMTAVGNIYLAEVAIMRVAVVLSVVVLAVGSASAQISDSVGLYLGEDDFTDYGQAADGVHTLYLVLRDVSAANGVYAWELALASTGPALLMPGDLTGDAVNYDSFPELSVGIGGGLPAVGGAVLLGTVQVMVLGQDQPIRLSIGPVSNPPGGSLGNDLPVYATWDGDQTFPLQNMIPASGAVDEPVFTFNDASQGPPESATWSSVKASYRD